MSARKLMLDRIRKKAKKLNEQRTNSDRKMSYEEVIFGFFKEMEVIYANAVTPDDFSTRLDSKSSILWSRMRSFDTKINVELIWNDTKDWEEFRLQGVKIRWSDKYLKDNPDQTKDMYIDVTNLLLNTI